MSGYQWYLWLSSGLIQQLGKISEINCRKRELQAQMQEVTILLRYYDIDTGLLIDSIRTSLRILWWALGNKRPPDLKEKW
jgi:hypothetical protein